MNDVDIAALDSGHLAHFAGLAWNERVLARMKAAGHPRVTPGHGVVFQHLLAGEQTTSTLAARMGVSQQAASKQVAALVRLGYVARARGSDRRTRVLTLTAKATAVIALARQTRARFERELRAAHGDAAVDAARAVLTAMLSPEMKKAIRARRVRP